ncbi:hypothetical protein [Nocardioides speluncae]|uniref:hypothetical protein n=1 Tax=Nocardioides speluncae TaxID=2670337 RepID=UPI000D68FDA4|nr:hypothetical protein [Nocardioides speluncae]
MRRFQVVRDEDVTGISGTGVVAEGVEFSDGTVAMRWHGPIEHPWGTVYPTTVLHPHAENVENLHGHNGATRIVWVD